MRAWLYLQSATRSEGLHHRVGVVSKCGEVQGEQACYIVQDKTKLVWLNTIFWKSLSIRGVDSRSLAEHQCVIKDLACLKSIEKVRVRNRAETTNGLIDN